MAQVLVLAQLGLKLQGGLLDLYWFAVCEKKTRLIEANGTSNITGSNSKRFHRRITAVKDGGTKVEDLFPCSTITAVASPISTTTSSGIHVYCKSLFEDELLCSGGSKRGVWKM